MQLCIFTLVCLCPPPGIRNYMCNAKCVRGDFSLLSTKNDFLPTLFNGLEGCSQRRIAIYRLFGDNHRNGIITVAQSATHPELLYFSMDQVS